MLVGLQFIYLLNVLGMLSKSSYATLWKFLDLKPTHFAVRIATPLKNNRITTEELGERVWYVINTSPKSVDTLNRINVFFLEIAETILLMLFICGRFQFFYRKSENVCG